MAASKSHPSLVIRLARQAFVWTKQVTISSVILAILIFIVVNFYIFSSIVNLNSFFYAFLILSILTDGAFMLVHLPRKRVSRDKAYFNPASVTIVIACHNGEDVIAETVKQARVHVPGDQIIVVDDASTDNTAKIARKAGARVLVNKTNLHKVGSINAAMALVDTPYVLILDDDTHIGESFIPTSLLDDGYTAVAFNVMPVKERSLINELQQFEYRSTMQISKNLRAATGAIGNVSGAIGLYHAEDLRRQISLHSGQFAGEDEQRTLLAHMYGKGKRGITYTDSLVLTQAPATYRELFRQRAFSWSLALPELFMLYWRLILSPRFHYLLKAEKAYYIYIYLTEPLRILFCWTLIMHPNHLVLAYSFYFMLNLIIWLRVGRKDTFRSVLLSPVYAAGLTVCRFIGYFYWLKVKGHYLARRAHRLAHGRLLLVEYAVVLLVIIGSWGVSVEHFQSDMHLFNKIRSDNLTNNDQTFSYDQTSAASSLVAALPPTDTALTVLVEQGDTLRAVAHKAVDKWLVERPDIHIDDDHRWYVDMWLASQLPPSITNQPNTPIQIPLSLVEQAVQQNIPGVSI